MNHARIDTSCPGMRGSHPVWFGLVAGVAGCLLLGAAGVAEAQRDAVTRALVLSGADGGSRIGVSIDEVADNDGVSEGAVVLGVSPDSPAASAGFTEGDVVVEFDGERVRSVRQLTRLVQETPDGRAVGAVVVRDGRRVELEVTPESGGRTRSREIERVVEFANGRGGQVARFFSDTDRTFAFNLWPPARLGATVQELTDQLADHFGVDGGVLVTRVEEGSAGAEAGLQAGDVITAIGGRAVDDVGRLMRRLSGLASGDEVAIEITRAGRELELTATLDDAPSGLRRRFDRRSGSPAI